LSVSIKVPDIIQLGEEQLIKGNIVAKKEELILRTNNWVPETIVLIKTKWRQDKNKWEIKLTKKELIDL
jgi:hypothetical protein